jgi:hypothetical protein
VPNLNLFLNLRNASSCESALSTLSNALGAPSHPQVFKTSPHDPISSTSATKPAPAPPPTAMPINFCLPLNLFN